jgi:hypothetical protein
MPYCRVELPNTGLGNRLFPWARCRVFSHLHGVPMFAPVWPQFKIGPLLRREKDLRLYTGMFQSTPDQIHYAAQPFLKWRSKLVAEPTSLEAFNRDEHPRNALFNFAGCEPYFAPLNLHHEFLAAELRKIVQPAWLAKVQALGNFPIAIHVRRGDFRPIDGVSTGNLRTPLAWFVESLGIIRRLIGPTLPVVIFSDGSPEELKELTDLPHVTLMQGNNAIVDLLLLSQARVLIGSGGSSFTAWASFMGRMPTITMPGHPLGWFKLENPTTFVNTFDPANPDPAFLQALNQAFPPAPVRHLRIAR